MSGLEPGTYEASVWSQGGDVKTAIVMGGAHASREAAQNALNAAGGFVRKALEQLRA